MTCRCWSSNSSGSSIVTIRSGRRDGRRKGVEERRFAAAGAARDEGVQLVLRAHAEEVGHSIVEGAGPDQVFHAVAVAPELPHGNRGVLGRRGRDGDVYARAVRQAGVDHRCAFVHSPANRGEDTLGHPSHVRVIPEGETAFVDHAVLLVVDNVRRVDHDLRNRLVVDQRLDRPEPQNLVSGESDELLAGIAVDLVFARCDEGAGGVLDEPPRLFGVGAAELLRVQAVDKRRVERRDERRKAGTVVVPDVLERGRDGERGIACAGEAKAVRSAVGKVNHGFSRFSGYRIPGFGAALDGHETSQAALLLLLEPTGVAGDLGGESDEVRRRPRLRLR